MKDSKKIGIIICNRYRDCAGGKCFRSKKAREGAFSIYDKHTNLEIVGYTTCGGCPGGNIEHAPEEMLKNGVDVIHLATGLVVGYPPCPHIAYFKKYIEERFKIPVVVGTHPIPQKYLLNHQRLGTWKSDEWKEWIAPTLSDEVTRLAYN
ncbi:CGGC domain-containing protein [Marinilabilia salmonicolor]|uniref:CGGC domain-containing protein n=1 Tax=Marinilabilia salmonicolor TaxID=989 RepID=UPI00029AE03A|nr:CGGC domain-containing protein [Marinilabilia salmonicolor]